MRTRLALAVVLVLFADWTYAYYRPRVDDLIDVLRSAPAGSAPALVAPALPAAVQALLAPARPEWLTDLQLVQQAAWAVNVALVARTPPNPLATSMTVEEIRRLAGAFATPRDLDHALLALPTQTRRDRARKTLEPFTAWGVPKWDGTDPHMAH